VIGRESGPEHARELTEDARHSLAARLVEFVLERHA